MNSSPIQSQPFLEIALLPTVSHEIGVNPPIAFEPISPSTTNRFNDALAPGTAYMDLFDRVRESNSLRESHRLGSIVQK
jgi:hypothetical protein